MQTPDSDSPPDVSSGRRRWPPRAEVSVWRRPTRHEDCGELTRQIGSRGVDAFPFWLRTTVMYCSNSPHTKSPDVPASPQGEVFRWVNRKLQAGPLLVTAINALRRARAKYAETARFSMFSIYRHGRICSLFTIHD